MRAFLPIEPGRARSASAGAVCCVSRRESPMSLNGDVLQYRPAHDIGRGCRAKSVAALVGALEQHRIAVAHEAVALRDRVRIGGADARRSRAKALTSISSVELRQVEVGQQPVDDAEPVARRDEQGGLAGAGARAPPARAPPPARAAIVVPTATTRPPRARAARSRRPSPAESNSARACIRCSAMSSTLTGWNVPAPTCSVTNARATPRASSASSIASSKCSPAVGAATAPGSRAYTVW